MPEHVITKFIDFPTYPKFWWYKTGTTHTFHFGLNKQSKNLKKKLFITNFLLVCDWSLYCQWATTIGIIRLAYLKFYTHTNLLIKENGPFKLIRRIL